MDWAGLFEHGRRQNNVLHIGDGEPFSISPDALLGRAKRERWVHPHRGVLLLPGAGWNAATRASAAVIAVGPPSVAAFRTAAHLGGLIDEEPPFVEVLIPHGRRAPKLSGVQTRRSTTLARVDVGRIHSVLATRPARTLVDLARVFPLERLRAVMLDGVQRKLVTTEEVADVYARIERVPQGGKVARLLEECRSEQPDSVLEHHGRRLIRSKRIDPPPAPRALHFRSISGRLWQLDIPWPTRWVGVEVDGMAFHRDRRSFERDRTKWSDLRRTGWTVVWLTWQRLHDDADGFIDELTEALNAHDPDRAPAVPV